MIYQIRHLTTYLYAKPVTFARCALRLMPRSDTSQRVLSHEVRIEPRPAFLKAHNGQFGETVSTATIEQPHRELTILATSRVAVNRPEIMSPLRGDGWAVVREQAFASSDLGLTAPAQFLFPTATTASQAPITAYVARSFSPSRPILEAAFEVACRIKADFAYDPSSTEVSTPPLEAFEARSGVCQDFAHVMIAGLRGIGLPAAYVSGYLRTTPPAGKPRLAGADATHAWVSLWCGDRHGWVGFDPTNGLVVADHHIILAIGRDYSDVAPIGGVILGPGSQTIKVAVDVTPVADEVLASQSALY